MAYRLLIIDENEDTLNLLEQALAGRYIVHREMKPMKGILMLLKNKVDLIILNAAMPGIDGIELCKVIKSNGKFSHLPVILASKENNMETKISGFNARADAFIELPFLNDYLYSLIDSIIENRRLARDQSIMASMAIDMKPGFLKADQQFLEELNRVIEMNLGDHKLKVQKLAKLMNHTHITLYRRVKALLDMSPVEVINLVRTRKAAALLATGEYKVYEISRELGFASQSNFSRSFQKYFKLTPAEFINSVQKNNLF